MSSALVHGRGAAERSIGVKAVEQAAYVMEDRKQEGARAKITLPGQMPCDPVSLSVAS